MQLSTTTLLFVCYHLGSQLSRRLLHHFLSEAFNGWTGSVGPRMEVQYAVHR